MRHDGKLDYLELPAVGMTETKAFYEAAFGWVFQDYGPTYAAFDEGLDGGFDADGADRPKAPLPILYASDLEAMAETVEAAGGRYVDVAVLAPVNPARMNVPLLVSGAAADEAAEALHAAGFANVRVVGSEVGRASAIKMIRSVMVKGIEALTAEMMLAADAAGVTDEVLASLDASEKPQGWAARAAYNLERMTTHGARRAAEMEESAKTLIGLGVEPVMTSGTVRRQRELAGKTDLFSQEKEAAQ
jgi:predicted enzyme related to lactoylglutathione lyase